MSTGAFQLCVPQSVIDELISALYRRRMSQRQGGQMVWKAGSRLAISAIDPDHVADGIAALEETIEWVRRSCAILPLNETLSPEKRSQRASIEAIGDDNADVLLLASDEGAVLYSDDRTLRAFAKSKLGVRSVWTQAVLRKGLESGGLSKDAYCTAVIALARLGYRHLSIDADCLRKAGVESDWLDRDPFASVASCLSGSQCDLGSAISVAVEFLSMLLRNERVFRRDAIAFRLLESLADGRQLRDVLMALKKAIQQRFRLDPFGLQDCFLIVQAWCDTRIV